MGIFHLAILRTTHVGDLTITEHLAAQAEWKALPVWKRMWADPPSGQRRETIESIEGDYPALSEATEAAMRMADALPDPLEHEVGIVIFDEDGKFESGFWSGDGGNM